jgi:secreted trypsin-like serine protease
MKVFAFLALIALSHGASEFDSVSFDLEIPPANSKAGARIVNGQAASTNQFPHQALLFIGSLEGTYQCGGSLISPLYVLSAAHCIIG